MLVTRERALMTQTIYVRRCDPGWAGRPGSLGVAGRGSLISPGVAGRRARIGDPPRPCQPWVALARDSLLALARPALLRVACLSFGFVDSDLPDSLSRCRRCRQSVERANTSLLTARRFWPAGRRPASRLLSRRSSAAPERTLFVGVERSSQADRPVSTQIRFPNRPSAGKEIQLILFRVKTQESLFFQPWRIQSSRTSFVRIGARAPTIHCRPVRLQDQAEPPTMGEHAL